MRMCVYFGSTEAKNVVATVANGRITGLSGTNLKFQSAMLKITIFELLL